ncbi:hypothetical protein RJ641_031671 [Dillenia turbinata]|uniref:WW domain-containing protein n=1 Tax=Dillenia turbinata TaxID=194707 RepID=A0AAN8ZL31_9MAGN
MVSFQTALSPNQSTTTPEFLNSSTKRKWEETETDQGFEKRSRTDKTKPHGHIDLQLETPLPSDWQRCLDIKTGQIYFYNTRTQKRTPEDPRTSAKRPSSTHMSLELELNLPYDSLRIYDSEDNSGKNSSNSDTHNPSNTMLSSIKHKNNSFGLKRTPSWLAAEEDQEEMVAAVCGRCHMLVMMCKSSPSCPNCKFMHPPNQTTPGLLKPSLSLLCCKD